MYVLSRYCETLYVFHSVQFCLVNRLLCFNKSQRVLQSPNNFYCLNIQFSQDDSSDIETVRIYWDLEDLSHCLCWNRGFAPPAMYLIVRFPIIRGNWDIAASNLLKASWTPMPLPLSLEHSPETRPVNLPDILLPNQPSLTRDIVVSQTLHPGHLEQTSRVTHPCPWKPLYPFPWGCSLFGLSPPDHRCAL